MRLLTGRFAESLKLVLVGGVLGTLLWFTIGRLPLARADYPESGVVPECIYPDDGGGGPIGPPDPGPH
jgi:hypothetical protein